MRRPGSSLRTLTSGLLALAISIWLSGCGDESRTSRPAAAGLQVHLAFPDKEQDSTPGAASVQTAQTVQAVQTVRTIRVSAWELPGGEAPRVLRNATTATIAPGETRFRLELQVPPANLYMLQVEAEGILGSTSDSTENGLLFLGRESIADLAAGETRSVEIPMHRMVPVLQGQTVPTGLSLQWSRVEGALGYRLREIPYPPSLPWETFTLRNDTLIVFPTRALAAAKEAMSYRVRAELPDSLVSAYSEQVGLWLPPRVRPAPIEDLTVVGTDTTEVRLEWTATGDDDRVGRAQEYDLRLSDSPIMTEDAFVAALRFSILPAPQTSGQREHFTVFGLVPATDYYFAIKAADDVPLWSPLSNTARGTTLPLPPAAPQDLAAEALSETAIGLHWTDRATNEALYRIERQSPTDARFVLAATMSGSFTGTVAYQDSNLTERTVYRYRVRAENAGGVSAWSNDISQRTKVARPRNLAATAVAADSVVLTWRYPFPHPADGFRLERRTGSARLFVEIGRPAAADRAFDDGGMQPLTAYAYRLRAADARDLSEWSDSVAVTTPDLPPVCRVEPTALDFATVSVDSLVDRAFTISNTGGGTLSGSVAVSCAGFSVVSGGDDFALRAGQTQEVTIRFLPRSPGAAQCVVTPTGGCSSVTCSGTGEALPRCSVDPTSLDFGTVTVGADSVQAFTITNIGGGTLSGSVTARCAYYSIDSGSGAFDLGAGESRVVTIRFAPSGERPSECLVNLGATDCSSVSCTGAGQADPICSLDPAALDFGVVLIGTFAEQSFTVTNTGGGTLPGIVGTSCGKYFTVVSGNGTFSLGAGTSRLVTVRFTPQSTTPSSCPLNLGGATSVGCPDLLLTGTGQGPICSVSTPSLDFGSVEVGERATRTFTVTNVGGGVLSGTISWLMCASSDFALDTGGGAYDLNPGISRTVTVAYTPSAAGVAVCQLATGCTDAVSCTGSSPAPNDHWWPGFFGDSPNGPVSTLALQGSDLAVGGNFAAVGDSPTGSVAWWNGSAWTTSADLTTWVNVDLLNAWGGSLGNGSLVAAGFAHELGGTATARWQNGTWVFLGGAFSGIAKAFATFQDGLFVGGDFTDPAAGLARWSGTLWEAADEGISGGSVNDLEAFGGTLYAAGRFVLPNGASGGAIYRLDGSSWTNLVRTINGVPLVSVQKLATHDGALYAIVTAGEGSYVARLKGTTLTSVGEADGGLVFDIASDGTQLYAVGTFAGLGGVVAERVAAWDGSVWHPLGSGISGGQASPTVILSFGGEIYVGGTFTTAGGKPSPNIARWIP